MKNVVFFLLLSLNLQAQNCSELPKIRAIFQAGVNEEQLEDMLLLCKKSTCDKTTPYHAAATMKKAEFVWSPISKLSNFNKGKKMLENFIDKNNKNIEARYIRWLTQKMAPSFLNYNSSIDKDYAFIIQNIDESNIEKSYQKTILNHLKKIQNE
ncbi:hypothetical protein FHR24_001227 [Wenyingzhuangia heitensis]|uniref:Uncharacterized protein n=1 Tax=Wenyingzhuangia heitensis TaxID=1487859 RepID=A0ABX0U7F9_9FLAO|nr:hypothetical protein [Wenyingzhuangia heitensis]NIJ44788.1 hypothetical protein [Wenyingzhuangia heitensis]